MVPMNTVVQESLFFADFEYRRTAGELFREGDVLALQPIPAGILGMLLERPGELVTRDDIIKRTWPNTTVDFDQRISSSIKQIRQALNDDSGQPRFIKTVPRQGYRFIAPVTMQQTAHAGLAQSAATPKPAAAWLSTFLPKYWPAVFAGIAAFIIAIFGIQQFSAPGASPTGSQKTTPILLVLPTTAQSEYDEELAAALTQKLMLGLSASKPQRFELIASDAAAAIAGAPDLTQRASKEFGAKYIMTIFIQRESGRRTVTAKIVNTDSQTLFWSGTFDLPFIERRKLSDAAAIEIVEALNQHFAP